MYYSNIERQREQTGGKNMALEFDNTFESGVKIKVVGVGGGGNNAVNRMISANIKGVDFVAVNTDIQVLEKSMASKKICIGEELTHGNGAGANPEVGRMSAEASADEIRSAIEGANMLFVAAGMGGGTGTGAAPVVARISKELGILTIGIVTKPFKFEGARRMAQADNGIREFRKYVDSLVVIPNERLKEIQKPNEPLTLMNAFAKADDVLKHGVRSISDLINDAGFVNLDFADVTSVMKDAGLAHMGVGEGSGENKTIDAANQAISSPLLETSIKGAHGLLVNITVSPEVGLDEVDIASSMIAKEAAQDANIIWGATFDETLKDAVKITIIATGFDKLPNQNIKIHPDDIDETTIKHSTQIKENDFINMVDIINDNKDKRLNDDFGRKKY